MTTSTDSSASIVWADRLNRYETIVAGFTTRHGGNSQSPFTSFNLGSTAGDNLEHVQANRRKLADAAGFPIDRIVIAGQIHGAEVLLVDDPGVYRGYDGLVTTTPDLLLCITAADCAAVLMADVAAGVIGACHSGWRGAVAGIATRTVTMMIERGADPGRIEAFVSPCISRAHFEVGPEVAEQFDPEFIYVPEGKEKPHVDLKGAVARQLSEAGLRSDAIEVSDRCTFGEAGDFFSYRKEGARSGRMMGFVGIRSTR
jgi:polyphenol oxidase